MAQYAFASNFAAGRIDREGGVIYGVSVMTVGPARGHGMMCDETTLEQVKKCAERYAGGLKVKMTHQGDAGDIAGFLTNFRTAGKKLLADLNLLKSYEKRAYVLELAETIPDTFGLSVSFSGPTEEKGGMEYARCLEIYSCDLVAEPAANPTGLFSAVVNSNVDAPQKAIPPMTSDEIKNQVQAHLNTALVEFSGRVKAIEEKLSSAVKPDEFAAVGAQVKELSAKLETAKTEFSTALADEGKRTQLAAETVAKAFVRNVGVVGLSAAPAGNGAPAEPSAADKFDGVLTKHFEATKSKARAWSLALAEDPKGYAAFLSAARKPAFEAAK